MKPSEFEEIVRQTLDDLPEDFKPLLENVVVQVEDEPSPDDLDGVGLESDEELLGLYHGVSLLDRGASHTGLPDRVLIYRGPILRCCDTPAEIRQQIRETVIHEIGHHIGLDDDEMVY
jgi:predicted Zn-dependent protease with MMP-like domain